MNGQNNDPIVFQLDYEMKPTNNDKSAPIGINELVPHTERFIEMSNITPVRDGDNALDVALINFTALHEQNGTRFKLAFRDCGVNDVRKHAYRLLAIVNFERGK